MLQQLAATGCLSQLVRAACVGAAQQSQVRPAPRRTAAGQQHARATLAGRSCARRSRRVLRTLSGSRGAAAATWHGRLGASQRQGCSAAQHTLCRSRWRQRVRRPATPTPACQLRRRTLAAAHRRDRDLRMWRRLRQLAAAAGHSVCNLDTAPSAAGLAHPRKHTTPHHTTHHTTPHHNTPTRRCSRGV
jgi:hypothetical protein